MQIEMKNHNIPEVEYDYDNECYSIKLQAKNNDEILISLSSTALRTFAMQCLHLIFDIATEVTEKNLEAPYLTDQDIDNLLAEGKTLENS